MACLLLFLNVRVISGKNTGRQFSHLCVQRRLHLLAAVRLMAVRCLSVRFCTVRKPAAGAHLADKAMVYKLNRLGLPSIAGDPSPFLSPQASHHRADHAGAIPQSECVRVTGNGLVGLSSVLGRCNSDFYMIRPNAASGDGHYFGCCSLFAQLAHNGDGVTQSSGTR